jgi:superfamily II DNA or RNA helicase
MSDAPRTFLCSRGYAVLKSEIADEKLTQIKDELVVRPFVPGAPASVQKQFYAYRESSSKLYIPRHFGEKHFGPIQQYKVSHGMDLDIAFSGELRQDQLISANNYLDAVKSEHGGGGLLELPCGFGKTTISLYIVAALKKKTIVIVNQESLLNQWVERIQQFIPGARVGRLQGQTIDIEDKDIVIAMLQSLSMKEYELSIFESFGLTIIDEVHHISSEKFSNALFKLVTKYMLGLSATMERKDGTSSVFKMFLGDVVCKVKRGGDDNVLVRGIRYSSQDSEFNEMLYDYRGNPQFSTMITKLCTFNDRSEFIVRVVRDMMIECPEQQIMILAHNKNLLTYLHDAISHRDIATVGYYIGGMKASARKLTEGKQIVIATYAMAAEGLDIKSLTTLMMVTPRSEIEQAVGRILRIKRKQPVVVDIIDSHDCFQKQWLKRKRFYKSQNYKIVETTSSKYLSTNAWTTTYDPDAAASKKRGKHILSTPRDDDDDDDNTTKSKVGVCLI